MLTSDFDYELPASSIAQTAIEPRDSARLLRVATMENHKFSDLPGLLRSGDLVVVNRTRVRRARLVGRRSETGGVVALLLLRPVTETRWEALARPARRLRAGVRLEFGPISAEVMTTPDEGRVEVELEAADPIEDVIGSIGELPLPPYFHGTLDDPERYQTLFAKVTGSAAAPTAALHFTATTLEDLADAGVELAEVELEVGLDTFRPMGEGAISDHQIHTEKYVVPSATAEAIAATRRRGGTVIAVGTTVMRTLESAAIGDSVEPGIGASELFIAPGYGPRVVNTLVTNFHAPRTTLVVLIASLIGDDWRRVYEEAIRRNYRFLSFGDAMLIENLQSLQ
ncbi:MAG: tRNA preQ1(34) S-adenosylmethionine ribosyltransferase-isomerase QueA [bacterium]|nr:tRNA preQ1(34) S-adenosylmethionine ribosyltransferase-isomerase QueA [bacterium]